MGKVRVKTTKQSDQQDEYPHMRTEQQIKLLLRKKMVNPPSDYKNDHRQANLQNDDQDNLTTLDISNLNKNSAQEITQFINKLIAKNKVSSKNAFEIPMIHLEQMEDYRALLNQNTWKRLSSTLQNDYKIYGYRVDATHTITYKMLESIARHQTSIQDAFDFQKIKSAKQQLVSSGNYIKTKNQLASKSELSMNYEVTNKLSVDYTKHIEKNQKLLNATTIQAFLSFNPGMQRTKRKFDQQGMKALLLNNIEMKCGGQLRLQEKNYLKAQSNQIKLEQQSFEQKNKSRNDYFSSINIEHIFEQQNKQNIQPLQKTSIFQEIYNLKLNSTDFSYNKTQLDEEFSKIQKLYSLLSGEQIKQVKLKKLQPQQLSILKQELDQNQFQQNQDSSMNQFSSINQCSSHNQLSAIQSKYMSGMLQVIMQQEHSDKIVNQQRYQLPGKTTQQNQINQNNSLELSPIKTQHEVQKQNQAIKQQKLDQLLNNQLTNKNFTMHEMKIQPIQSQSYHSPHRKQTKQQYLCKYKNIDEYIKLKKFSKESRRVLKTQQMSSQEINQQLFNRKAIQRKLFKVKNQDNNIKLVKTHKIAFKKVLEHSTRLTTSIVFKKHPTDQRNFNKIKSRFGQPEDQLKRQITQEPQKKLKNKNLFDLPSYEFYIGDKNYLQPSQQTHAITKKLAISSVYIKYPPSFIFSAEDFLHNQKLVTKLKQNQSQQLNDIKKVQCSEQRIIEQQKRTEQQMKEPTNQMVEQTSQLDIMQLNKYLSMGKSSSKQQLAIRQTKQKMSFIIQKIFQFSSINSKRSYQSIRFKDIYDTYLKQQSFVTPALSFLTILHLANEHNLILKGQQDGVDFQIIIDKSIRNNKLNTTVSQKPNKNVIIDSHSNITNNHLNQTTIKDQIIQKEKQSFNESMNLQ